VIATLLTVMGSELSFAGNPNEPMFLGLFVRWLFVSPTFFFGLIFCGALLIAVARCTRLARCDARDYIWLLLLGTAGTGAKGTVLPVLVAALGLWALWRWIRERQLPVRAIIFGVCLTTAFVVVYMPTMSSWRSQLPAPSSPDAATCISTSPRLGSKRCWSPVRSPTCVANPRFATPQPSATASSWLPISTSAATTPLAVRPSRSCTARSGMSGHPPMSPSSCSRPPTDAYDHVDALEQRLLKVPADIFLLSLGPTATVLAARLSRRGRRAIDIGHITSSYRTVFLGDDRPEDQPVTPNAGRS
jgi:hypothetical protein